MSFQSGHSEREERLIELLASANGSDGSGGMGPDGELETLRADPLLEESARETEAILAAARRLSNRDAEELAPLRESRLVGRILARTTREDLSWRGDWSLWRRFVVERFAHSNALRWVAASLVAHLLALPFFGTELFRSAPKPISIRFEVPEEALPEREPAPERALAVPEEEPSPAAIENALRRGRYVLSRTPALKTPAAQELGGAPLEIRLLAERSHGLGRNGADGEISQWVRAAEELDSADVVQVSLWAEVLLDAYCLRGEQPASLAFVLSRLSLLAEKPLPSRSAAEETLVAGALSRARSYGLWEAEAGFDMETAAMPFQASWGPALGEILEQRTGVRWPWMAPWTD